MKDSGTVTVFYGSGAGLVSTGNQLLVSPESYGDLFGFGLAAGDFDGDGFDDLSVLVHFQEKTVIFRGGSAGLSQATKISWVYTCPGLMFQATGDFNGDGFDDIAVGEPFACTFPGDGDPVYPGVVLVRYGSAGGLVGGRSEWHQDSDGIADQAEEGDRFGGTLAAGDFNADGYADLAIGVPGEDFPCRDVCTPPQDAGAVNILYGSSAGLTAAGNQMWYQNSDGILDDPEPGDAFGAPLASGDFNADGYADLAIGVPGEDFPCRDLCTPPEDAGAVNILYGSPFGGLTAAGNQFWSQNSTPDLQETDDHFGASLATGDYDGNGAADLAVGVPFEDFPCPFRGCAPSNPDAGAVNVLYGTPVYPGLTSAGSQLWSQDSPGPEGTGGVLENAENGDHFGTLGGAHPVTP